MTDSPNITGHSRALPPAQPEEGLMLQTTHGPKVEGMWRHLQNTEMVGIELGSIAYLLNQVIDDDSMDARGAASWLTVKLTDAHKELVQVIAELYAAHIAEREAA